MSELLTQMKKQIEKWETGNDDRAIFLMCYSMMTDNMLQEVAHAGFEDNPWVTRLTHSFAAYYFDALNLYETNQTPPVWTLTFEIARQKQAHVLQNLLLGVNAHICYDLIFSVADIIQDEWEQLDDDMRMMRYRDYSHVNDIIGTTLDAVQDEVVESRSPIMDIIDHAFGRLDEWMIHTLIKRWREQVWQQSIEYVTTPLDKKPALKRVYIERAEQRARAIQGQRGIRGIIDLF